MLLLACRVTEVDAIDRASELMVALADYLDGMEPSYRERTNERREQFPQIWLHSSIQLPGPDGVMVELPAVAHYHHDGRPDRVDVLYGGEGFDPPMSTWADTWHGHIVVYRNDQAPSGVDRWRVVIWLAPGVRGNRELLLREP